MRKTIEKLLALCIVSVVALSGCSATNSSASKTASSSTEAGSNAEKDAATSEIKEGTTSLLSVANDLKKEISSGDETEIKNTGTKLEDTWSTFEDSVKPKYPDVYENIEKYLDPITAGSKITPIDKQALSKLDAQLIQVLNDSLKAIDADGKKSK